MDGSFFMVFICFYMFLLIYVHLLQGKPYLSLRITAEMAALVRNPALSWSPFRPTQGEIGKVSIPNGPKILNQYISIVNICACSIKPDPPSCCCPCCQLYCPAQADAKGTFWGGQITLADVAFQCFDPSSDLNILYHQVGSYNLVAN